ncbi:MAG TPA: MarR family transcriptional regulator [Bacteroidota bacterium]|nr:MarR family transcriptional regulator [Bacteroidota bacterium]
MKTREGYYSEQVRNEAFREILPHLSAHQYRVYSIIANYGPISTEEIACELGVYPHTITPRVKELREMELIEFAGIGASATSGRTVSLWRTKTKQLKLF